jgi:mannosyltransferase PIG-V
VSAAAPESSASPRPPLWVRLIDIASIAALVLALSVLLFGGFRVMVAGTRVSVTDWWRPALWSLALMALRQWRWRHEPAWRRAARAVAGWWTSPDTRVVFPIHLSTRLGVLAIGFLSVVLIGFPFTDPPPIRIYDNAFLDLPARWDAGWYLTIANDGYQWSPASAGTQQNIAFFPAFPLLTRYVAVVLGRQPLWAGVAVSLVAFFWALVYFLRLAREHLGDDDRAAFAVLLLAAYPFAIFFSAPYSEALFLLAMLGAVWHFRRGELWKAAGWGLVVGLSRPNGAFLSVALGLMVLEDAWRSWRTGGFPWAQHMDRLAVAATPGLGMLLYSTYILFLTGSPFQWTAQNAAWGRTYRSLDTLVTDRVDFVAEYGLYHYASNQALDVFYLLSVLFILAAVWPVYRRWGVPYAVLLLVNLLPPLAMGGMLSIGRVTSTLFPAFLWLAAAVPARHRTAWAVAFAGLQSFAAVMFFTWRPLY